MPELTNLLKKASISLILDRYESIFSDFDPRPFDERSISDDFLLEAQKAVRETEEGTFELHFLIPRHLHNPHEDEIIKERLHHHFKKSLHQLEISTHKSKNKGILLTILGFLTMILASLTALLEKQSIWFAMVLVVIEPAGWFMVWYGLDVIFYTSREKNTDLVFYQKMTKADIHFDSY